MEVGGWVGPGLTQNFLCGKSSQNSSKQELIFWRSIPCVFCLYMGHFHKKGQITVKTWRSIFNPVGTRYLCISIDICMPFDTYVL